MITLLLCFIFNHKRTWHEFTGEYGMQYDRFTGKNVKVPVMIEKYYKICPRCGVNLEKNEYKTKIK